MPTIGVAVAIPEPWATELQDYRASVGDTTASMIPTHITLVPPTDVADELGAIEKHLTAAAACVLACVQWCRLVRRITTDQQDALS